MFKKSTTIQSVLDIRSEMQHKAINHEFFLLVRDQKYQEAYALGMMYLKYHPENNSIRQFCEFIQGNKLELIKMVSDERDYTDGSSDEDDEDQQEDSEQEDQDQKSVISQASSIRSSKSSVSSKTSKPSFPAISSKPRSSIKNTKGKENGVACQFHKWDHKCKNESCPNKSKKNLIN